MPTKKDVETERLRRTITSNSDVVETDYADCGLTTLSFQSVSTPQRHVWMDTDLGGQAEVDLEDWSDDSQWDNSVAHAASKNSIQLAEIAVSWLMGKSLGECKDIASDTVKWR